MRRASRGTIWLDYADAGRKRKFLPNISAVAASGDYLWTASDEMRTVECLEPARAGISPASAIQAGRALSRIAGSGKRTGSRR